MRHLWDSKVFDKILHSFLIYLCSLKSLADSDNLYENTLCLYKNVYKNLYENLYKNLYKSLYKNLSRICTRILCVSTRTPESSVLLSSRTVLYSFYCLLQILERNIQVLVKFWCQRCEFLGLPRSRMLSSLREQYAGLTSNSKPRAEPLKPDEQL